MLSFTKDLEYALLCVASMAEEVHEVSSASALAQKHGISQSLVAKILQKLHRAGILDSSPGMRGGYRLVRDPAATTVEDIVQALDHDPHLMNCASKQGCDRADHCTIRPGMQQLQKSMWAVMGTTTIADLVSHESVSAGAR